MREPDPSRLPTQQPPILLYIPPAGVNLAGMGMGMGMGMGAGAAGPKVR